MGEYYTHKHWLEGMPKQLNGLIWTSQILSNYLNS